MYKFWYDYVKPKYSENAKFCSFNVHLIAEDIHKDISEDVEKRFDISNFELDRPLRKGKNKKVIGSMKHELDGQIMKELVALRAKTYSFLKDNNNKNKKAKDTKKCAIKRKLKFQDCKNCLGAAQIENKINNLEKNKIDVDSLKEHHKKTQKRIN